MTTETKAPTAEDVEQLYGAVRADVRMHIRVAGERALAGLRDLALLGAKVPVLVTERDDWRRKALDRDLQVVRLTSEVSALQARVVALEGEVEGAKERIGWACPMCLHPEGECPNCIRTGDLLAERADLQTRVAELTRDLEHERANSLGLADAGLEVEQQRLDLVAERDALRAQVGDLQGRLATEEAERIRCRDGWAEAALSAPPAEAKTAEKPTNDTRSHADGCYLDKPHDGPCWVVGSP